MTPPYYHTLSAQPGAQSLGKKINKKKRSFKTLEIKLFNI